jgi:hypothetical protein
VNVFDDFVSNRSVVKCLNAKLGDLSQGFGVGWPLQYFTLCQYLASFSVQKVPDE